MDSIKISDECCSCCSVCGRKMYPNSNFIITNNGNFCSSCIEDSVVQCDSCAEYFKIDQTITEKDITLCNNCYEMYYCRCNKCNKILDKDFAPYCTTNDTYLCHECHALLSDNMIFKEPIHSYGYKPNPLFHGGGHGKQTRYFGVELEVGKGGSLVENAKQILYTANKYFTEYNIYIKHDGSVYDGFEIVSHPMDISCHKNVMPWKEILSAAESLGYSSHDTNNCGLHIHVNRSGLGTDIICQNHVIARIIYFIENNWDNMVIFSRREPHQIETWAKRYKINGDPKEILNKLTKKSYGRRRFLNIENKNTIEFRLFRGTLKLNTLIASLEFVDAICQYCCDITDEEIVQKSWSNFVESIITTHKYSSLVDYLSKKKLYSSCGGDKIE